MKLLTPPWDFETVRFEAGVVSTKEDLVECFRLRYHAFCEPTRPGDPVRLPPENYPDGLERDEFDAHSIHILAKMVQQDGQSLSVGTFRLIRCEHGFFMDGKYYNGYRFALPRHFDGKPIEVKSTLEASRWVGPAITLNSGDKVLTSMLLLEVGLAVSKLEGSTHWVCSIDDKSVNNLRRDGWPFKPIIPGVFIYYHNSVEVCILELGDYHCRRVVPANGRVLTP